MFTSLLLVVLCACACLPVIFGDCKPTAGRPHTRPRTHPALVRDTTMPHFSAEAKHAILLEYTRDSRTHSFAALAVQHAVRGGRDVVRRWHQRWRGTVRSLQTKPRPGRPRILSTREVRQHVRGPILAANRSATAVHYTTLAPTVRRATGKNVSVRTLRRYGKEELGARDKHTRKRTLRERQCARARCVAWGQLWAEHGADELVSCLQCRLTHAMRSLSFAGSCASCPTGTCSSSTRPRCV